MTNITQGHTIKPLFRYAWLSAFSIYFSLIYFSTNHAPTVLGRWFIWPWSWVNDWPLWPCTVLPYMALTPLLMLGFFGTNHNALNTYGQRLLICTTVAGCCFVYWPIRNSYTPELMPENMCSTLLSALRRWDQPFNQIPSLHVAYAVIWGSHVQHVLQKNSARWALWILVSSIIVSTLGTHQHHVPDVLTGLALGFCCLAWKDNTSLARRIALAYAGMSMLLLMLHGIFGSWWLLYLALSCGMVSWMYAAQKHAWLIKRKGHFSIWQWVIWAPYLAAYQLTWLIVVFKERAHPPFRQISPNVWVGRRLGHDEKHGFDASRLSVFDLSNELTETLATGRYQHFPWLDLTNSPEGLKSQLLTCIDADIRSEFVVYIHCAMGYDRSAQVAQWWIEHTKAP